MPSGPDHRRTTVTPARELSAPLRGGCHVLEDTDLGHYDGGEDEVRAILERATDRSALSDELSAHRGTWETRYHFAKERSNILRPLALGPDQAVLEIGAGCGAITRYLGETCGLVDALEPTPERAEIARLRTADLDSVEVFIGSLDAIPRVPAYDVVVIVGVLEYVGGSGGTEPRVAWLREAAARLRPNGSVVCAIENRFGVQYLAGAPEDHLGVAFVGLEGYRDEGPARTFSRRELETMFTSAGLTPSVQHVFPDYKFARLVYSDAMLEGAAAPLAWRAPIFPSAASPHPRPRLADEGLLWRGLVESGLGGQLANSFLVVAGSDGLAKVWPDGLQAAFYSRGRGRVFASETQVLGHADRPRLNRRRLANDVATARSGTLQQRVVAADWVDGVPLLEELETAGETELASWLRRWRSALEALPVAPIDVDFVPHNLVIAGHELVTVDEEWFDDGYTATDVLDRGVLHLGLTLSDRRSPGRWPGRPETVGDVVNLLASLTGVPDLATRIDDVIRREADLLDRMTLPDHPDEAARERRLEQRVEAFRAELARALRDTALGDRQFSPAGPPGSRVELERLHRVAHEQHLEIDRLHAEVARRDAEIERRKADAARTAAAPAAPELAPGKAPAQRLARLGRSLRGLRGRGRG